jgi:hypothetical protein
MERIESVNPVAPDGVVYVNNVKQTAMEKD